MSWETRPGPGTQPGSPKRAAAASPCVPPPSLRQQPTGARAGRRDSAETATCARRNALLSRLLCVLKIVIGLGEKF